MQFVITFDRIWRQSLKYRQNWPCTKRRGLRKGLVEYTSRISNKLREMESGFKELPPPKLNGFIIKRQAKLTHDQAKHLHFYIPTRGLEADKMVDALNILDQTDSLVEQILRSTVVTRIQTAMRRRIRWKLKLPRQPNRTSTITTKRRRTRRVISWIGILKN